MMSRKMTVSATRSLTTPSSTNMYATIAVVNSSRKSSTHRWTTQKRQNSVVVKLSLVRAIRPTA